MSAAYKISIGSTDEYEDLIGEIWFPNNVGIVISQEKSQGDFNISIYSLHKGNEEDFFETRNKPEYNLSLNDFLEAIDTAKSRLEKLRRADTE